MKHDPLGSYQEALSKIPPQGGGWHNAIMRPARLGKIKNIPRAQIAADIIAASPGGCKPSRVNEVYGALDTVFKTPNSDRRHRPRKPAAAAAQDQRSPTPQDHSGRHGCDL